MSRGVPLRGTGPLFAGAIERSAADHKGNLAADIVDTKPTAGVEPEHSPIHSAKHRQTEGVPVAVGVKRKFVDETRENLFILVTLTDQLPYALGSGNARRSPPRAGPMVR
jgi:hypothetical protein